MSASDPPVGAPRAAAGAEGNGAVGADLLATATAALRQHTDAGWTRIRASVLSSAVAAFRPSAPVRGRHEAGDFFVAADVLVARVREVVDARVDAAAQRITVDTDEDHDLRQVLIQLIAAYGSSLLDLAASVRRAAAQEISLVLGTTAASEKVAVDIHVGDVTDDADRL